MHLALRPYVTTGVAIVGATVIAVAPMHRYWLTYRSPTQRCSLTARYNLPANEGLRTRSTPSYLPLLRQGFPLPNSQCPSWRNPGILASGEGTGRARHRNPRSLLLGGSLISGPGAAGSATQDVIDALGSGNLATIINALVGAPGTVLDGVVNGGYGPNLTPLWATVDLPIPIPPSSDHPGRGTYQPTRLRPRDNWPAV